MSGDFRRTEVTITYLGDDKWAERVDDGGPTTGATDTGVTTDDLLTGIRYFLRHREGIITIERVRSAEIDSERAKEERLRDRLDDTIAGLAKEFELSDEKARRIRAVITESEV